MDSSQGTSVIQDELAEKTSGSKMLKKAQSFREDIRNRIRRRPSTGVQQMIPDGKGKRKGDGTMAELNPADDDMESLKAALAEVNKTLIFIKAVVSKGKLEVLPGSASVILETVMQIFTLLRYPKLAHESNSLVSSQSKVCQHLAKFIQWTDDSLVGIHKTCDQQQAHTIIDTLLEGIQELTTLGMEKMSQKKSSLQAPITSQPLPSPPHDGSKHGPLPDIPLTPREQEILAQTNSDINYDNFICLARNNSSTSSTFSFDPSLESTDTPPPKPPLPAGSNLLLLRNCQDVDSIEGQDPLLPPPLPQKKRSPSSSTEILETLSGRVVPPFSPTSSLICGGGHAAAGASVFNHTNSPLDIMGPPASRSSLPSSTSASSFPLMNHRSTGDLITSSSSSSSSSISSAHWQEQQLEKGKTTTQTFSRTVSDSKLVSSTVVSGKAAGKTCDEINELTSQIKKLTHCIEEIPPPLPAKKNQVLHRLNSQYDNVPELVEERMAALSSMTSQQRTVYTRKVERISSSSTCSSQSGHSNQNQRSMQSFLTEERASSQETYSSSETFSSTSHSSTESLPKPPPLPPKKKHVQAYVQMFGAVTQPSALEESISRHSIQFYEAQWQQHQRELFYPRSNTISVFSDISSDSSLSGGSMERLSTMQSLPVKMKRMSDISHGSQFSTESSQSDVSHGELLALCKLPSDSGSVSSQSLRLSLPQPVVSLRAHSQDKEVAPLAQPEIQKDSDSDFCELNLLDDVEVEDQLILKKQEEDGPDVRGGAVDALIVHATQAGQREFIYQEAFLTTYRMFISPKMLMDKLLYRFQKFQHATDQKKKVAHNNAFSLLIRVVDELGVNELDSVVVDRLMNLVYDLICERELNHARLLRKILLDKCEKKQTELAEAQHSSMAPIQSIELSSSSTDLLSFKAHDVAEQMTLLDAQLFQKIEIPEVLMWAREQSEELSPHLTTFTEHFNKMSYWCRTQILTQDDPKERERYLLKFIKIMRHLRKLHNFNSYLAILSALDSAPVRRLEWQKQNIEALQEFCQLIDSSSSFRAYRQALSETEPPCIPYLGLILQDLTFVNIGNPDKLTDGSVNFAKHWQQFNILDSMRRFRSSCYQLKRHEKVMNFLNNFEGYLNEDILWQISQKIKPRPVGHRKQNSIS